MGIFDKKYTMKIEQEDLRDAKLSTAGFDKDIKKRAFLNVLSARVAMKMLFEQDIEADNAYSLYTIQNILKRFDVSDIYCGSTKLDVRTVFSKEEIFIPKAQYENSITPDLYLFFEVASDAGSAEFLGFISPDKINKANSNDKYYFVEMTDLNAPDELNNAIAAIPEKTRENIPDAEIKIAQDMFISVADNDISDKNLKNLLSSLVNSYALRKSFVEFENFELISAKSADENSGVINDSVLDIVGAQDVYEDVELSQEEEKAEIIDSVLTDLIETEELKASGSNSPDIAGAAIKGAVEGLAAGAAAAGVIGAAEALTGGVVGSAASDMLGAVASGSVEGVVNSLSGSNSKDDDFMNELADNSTLPNKNKQNENQSNDKNNSDEDDLKILSVDEEQDISLEDLVTDNDLEDLSEISTSLDEINLDDTPSGSQDDLDTLLTSVEQTLDDVISDDETTILQSNELDDLLNENPLEELGDTTIDEKAEINSLDNIGFADEVPELPLEELNEVSKEEPVLNSLDDVGFADITEETEEVSALENVPETENLTLLDDNDSQPSFTEAKTSEANSIFADADVPFEGLPELNLNYAQDVPDYMKGMMSGAENAPQKNSPNDTQEELQEDFSLPQVEENIVEEVVEDVKLPAETEDLDIEDLKTIENSLDEAEELVQDAGNVEQDISTPNAVENIAETTPVATDGSDDTDSFISEIDNFLNSIDGDNANAEGQEEEISIDDIDIENIPETEDTEISNTDSADISDDKDPLRVLYKKAAGNMSLPSAQNIADKFKNKKMIVAAAVIVIAATSLFAVTNMGSNQQNVPAEDDMLAQMQDENRQKREDEFNQTLPQDVVAQEQQPVEENQMAQNAQTHTSQSMEEAMSNAFSAEPINANVTKIAWEIPERYAYNNEFRQYLQIVGKNLKLNLQNELILSDSMAYSDRVIVNLKLANDGSLQNSELVHSSGSKGIDKIVLQSVNTTFNYLKMHAGTIKDAFVETTLIINF